MQQITFKKFKKQYKKLSEKTKDEFKRRFVLFVENPFNPLLHVHGLSGEYADCQSFNVNSDIRCVFRQIDKDIVELVVIGSHSELYE